MDKVTGEITWARPLFGTIECIRFVENALFSPSKT